MFIVTVHNTGIVHRVSSKTHAQEWMRFWARMGYCSVAARV